MRPEMRLYANVLTDPGSVSSLEHIRYLFDSSM
jgi:hypothetical protein